MKTRKRKEKKIILLEIIKQEMEEKMKLLIILIWIFKNINSNGENLIASNIIMQTFYVLKIVKIE
jgi:hypothetical protein